MKTAGGKITRYFYDKEDILFEYDGHGNMGNRYVHGAGTDEPLSLINSSGTFYYHADSLGSIVASMDKNQKVVQTYDYYYFGKLKDEKNRIKQPYRFTGREWDKEINLYYRARYYDADVGRFTQFDPVLHPTYGQYKTEPCTGEEFLTHFDPLIIKPE